MWLRANMILPALFAIPMVAVVGGVLYLVYSRFGDRGPVKVFVALGALLLVSVTGAVALHIANNFRDARDGTARETETRVLAKRESGRSPKSFYLDCEAVGTLIVLHDVYQTVTVGSTYRVVYSARTKRCWTAELVSAP
jgi:hypothetical protein